MNIADTCRTDGLLAGIDVDRETVLYAGRKVAAIVNRQPLTFEMADAGNNTLEPIDIEVFKGSPSSTDTVQIDGVDVPLDLRGVVPRNNDPILLDGVNRITRKVFNCSTAWIISTIKAN